MAGAVEDDVHGLYGYGLWTEVVDGRTWLGHSGGMVGYTALLVAVPEEGLACVMLQNGGGDRRPVVAAALAAVRAGLAGDPSPDVWTPPAPTEIPDTDRFTGTYVGDDGRTLIVEAADAGLSVSVGSVSARLERDPLDTTPGQTFLVAHPAFERFPLEFRNDDSDVSSRPSTGARGSEGSATRGRSRRSRRRRGAGTRVSTVTTTRGARCSGSSSARAGWPSRGRRTPMTRRAASSSPSTRTRSRWTIPRRLGGSASTET